VNAVVFAFALATTVQGYGYENWKTTSQLEQVQGSALGKIVSQSAKEPPIMNVTPTSADPDDRNYTTQRIGPSLITKPTMKNQLNTLSFITITVTAFLLTSCKLPESSSPTPQTTQVQCTLPKIDVIADKVNQQTQSKGGLDITVVPALFKSVRADRTTTTQVQPSLPELMLMNQQTQVVVEQNTIPQLKAEPARVVFTVKIHNQLNRVFHGQGSVVQFNVDGKLIPFNNTDYKEFSGGIVPPLNDSDFKISGPPLDLLRDKGTISIFVYDVITATDVAGRATEKQNYTWDFSYTMQVVTENGEVKKTRGLMGIGEYQQIMMQQQRALQNQ
jgi:hypothetical protein